MMPLEKIYLISTEISTPCGQGALREGELLGLCISSLN